MAGRPAMAKLINDKSPDQRPALPGFCAVCARRIPGLAWGASGLLLSRGSRKVAG